MVRLFARERRDDGLPRPDTRGPLRERPLYDVEDLETVDPELDDEEQRAEERQKTPRPPSHASRVSGRELRAREQLKEETELTAAMAGFKQRLDWRDQSKTEPRQ